MFYDIAVMARRTEPSARRTVAHAVFVGVTFGLAISIVTLTRKHQLSGPHEDSREVYGQGSRKVATVSSSGNQCHNFRRLVAMHSCMKPTSSKAAVLRQDISFGDGSLRRGAQEVDLEMLQVTQDSISLPDDPFPTRMSIPMGLE